MNIDDEKVKIKAWMKKKGIVRDELAEICSVSVSTVNSWMATRKIPPAKLALIRKHMKESEQNYVRVTSLSFNIVLSGSVYEKMEKSALEFNISVSELVERILEFVADHPEIKSLLFKSGKRENKFVSASSTDREVLAKIYEETLKGDLSKAAENPGKYKDS